MDRESSQQLQMWFSEHFSRQNLLRSLSRLLFLLRWNKYGAKKCLKNHILFNSWVHSTLANQGAGKTIEKPLKKLPWNQQSSCESICPICKSEKEDNYNFLLHCKAMTPEFDLFWSKLFSLIETKATFEADVIINFLRNIDEHNKVLLLTGGLKLPFQHSVSEPISRFIMVSVHKLVRIHERLVARGIITPNRSSFSFHDAAC